MTALRIRSSLNAMRSRTSLALARATIAALTACLAAGVARAQARPAEAGERVDTALEVASFDSAWRLVRDTYYDTTMRGLDWAGVRGALRPLVARATTHNAARAVISRMLDTLGDSHFGVVPGASRSDNDAASDTPGDVGLDLRFIGRDLVVTRVDSGSSAAAAGVMPGWIVDAVDSTPVSSLAEPPAGEPDAHRLRVAALKHLMAVMRRLHGAPGSVTHVAFRDTAGRPARRELVRHEARGAVVRLGALPPLVAWLDSRRVQRPGGCVGVIRFNVWMTSIVPALDDAVSALRDCAGIVIDLRGNVGGLGAMVSGVAGYFVTTEMPLGTMHMRASDLRYVANPRRVTRHGERVEPFGGALALVVDELSASTTEIFAAGLQQQGRARVFGDTTAGEALPSLLTRLPNGDGLQYAVADLTDPAGRRLEGRGVVPDELVPLTRASLTARRDDAMDAAIAWAAQAPRGRPVR